ncbi:MAG: hypothetical protein WAK17_18980 [Candidatus Nitrosopolaris sp.]
MKNYYSFFGKLLAMSNYSEEDVRRAADIREWLTKQVADKQEEIERLRTMLLLVDLLLKRGSFKTASSFESAPSSSLTLKPSDQSSITAGYPQTREAASSDNDTMREFVVPSTEQQVKTLSSLTEVRHLRRVKDNLLLATATLTPTRVEITPADGIKLNVNTQPFKSFFLNRILEGMKARDVEKINRGDMKESESLDYQIEERNGALNKIMISNYRDKERLNEIFNTSTWVLTRMMEKNDGK